MRLIPVSRWRNDNNSIWVVDTIRFGLVSSKCNLGQIGTGKFNLQQLPISWRKMYISHLATGMPFHENQKVLQFNIIYVLRFYSIYLLNPL